MLTISLESEDPEPAQTLGCNSCRDDHPPPHPLDARHETLNGTATSNADRHVPRFLAMAKVQGHTILVETWMHEDVQRSIHQPTTVALASPQASLA